jgi:Ca2+-binding RTX toxin-like protein
VADYPASPDGINVTMQSPSSGLGSDAQGDVLSEIEAVVGSAFSDWITGGILTNDSLVGGAGQVLLRGAGGNDTLDGGSENETFAGGSGADRLIGGSGTDTAD